MPTSEPILNVTTETVAGHRIVRTLGYVEGRGRGEMTVKAQRLGANAVVGLRWAFSQDYRGDFQGNQRIIQVPLVYGTAVMIEPEAD